MPPDHPANIKDEEACSSQVLGDLFPRQRRGGCLELNESIFPGLQQRKRGNPIFMLLGKTVIVYFLFHNETSELV